MYQYLDNTPLVQKLSHDLAGLLMTPLAAAMFALVLMYLSRLVQPVEVMGLEEFVGRERS
jgi:hypothetical protein